MAGLWFEEFEIGQVFKHQITRTVTETDNLLFTALSHNLQPLHLDAEFAREHGEFGGILVNSMFTMALMIGVTVVDTTLGTTVANLAMNDMRFPKPVMIGDTLRTETTVIEKRPSRSRPEQGLVTFRHQSFNQRGEMVATCDRTALMKRKPA